MKLKILLIFIFVLFWRVSYAGFIDWAQRADTNEHLEQVEKQNKSISDIQEENNKLLKEILQELKKLNTKIQDGRSE